MSQLISTANWPYRVCLHIRHAKGKTIQSTDYEWFHEALAAFERAYLSQHTFCVELVRRSDASIVDRKGDRFLA